MDEALNSGWLVAISVAVIPAILGIIGNLFTREARTPRQIRNLGHLAESLSKVDTNSSAHTALSELIADYTFSIKSRLVDPPKLNKLNVGFTLFVFATTLGIMFGLSQWVTNTSETGWNVLAIVITALVGLFLFLVNIAAVGLWYKPASTSAKGK
ncbi:hypothetical protein V6245_11865 [Salinibacterium amurskyense]|uniref:hypothetical protein n=1 Tax=Salinibacterium amurskyense TaxID=205941 RepID=UPI00311FCC9B